MVKKISLLGLSCFSILLLNSVSPAEEIVFDGAGMEKTIECHGQAVEVSGASNKLTLVGECPELKVSGSSNVVKVEQVGNIQVQGAYNKILWLQALAGDKPQISDAGFGNKITRGYGNTKSAPVASTKKQSVKPGTPASGARVIDINDSEVSRSLQCQGEDIKINGHSNALHLRGECGEVTVNGNENVVKIEAARAISVMGDENTIKWLKGVDASEPQISNVGSENTIRKGR